MAKTYNEIAERFDFNRAALAKQRLANLRHAGGKIRGNRIANLLRTAGIKEESEIDDELITQLDEVLGKDATADQWIHDFVHSTNSKFEGKSKKERINMALGAYYAKAREKQQMEEVEQIDEKSEQARRNKTMKNVMDASKGAQFNRTSGLNIQPGDTGHQNKQQMNKALGRALRKEEEAMHSFSTHTKLEEGRNEGDVPFDKPYKTATSPVVKDKSGAVHTPMSRARDLARMALKKQQQQKVNEAKKETGPVDVDKVHAAGQEPHEEKWVSAKKKPVAESYDEEGNLITMPKSYQEFMEGIKIEVRPGVTRHIGTYGTEFAKAEREKDEKGFDADTPKRGPKVGSKRGPRANLGNSKLHKTI